MYKSKKIPVVVTFNLKDPAQRKDYEIIEFLGEIYGSRSEAMRAIIHSYIHENLDKF